MQDDYTRRKFISKTGLTIAGAGTAVALTSGKTPDANAAQMNSMAGADGGAPDAAEFGKSLTGVGISLLVTDVAAAVEFSKKILNADAMYADDSFAMIGSANMNGRSMRWDTEVALRITDKQRVAKTWQAICAHWWHREQMPAEARAVEAAADWWHREIQRNGVRLPQTRSGFLVPHDPQKMADLHQSLPGATEDVV